MLNNHFDFKTLSCLFITLAVVLVALLFIDREALKAVDYPLLLTFVMFFIFAGNMSRIEAVNNLLLFALMNTIFLGVLTVATFFLFK